MGNEEMDMRKWAYLCAMLPKPLQKLVLLRNFEPFFLLKNSDGRSSFSSSKNRGGAGSGADRGGGAGSGWGGRGEARNGGEVKAGSFGSWGEYSD